MKNKFSNALLSIGNEQKLAGGFSSLSDNQIQKIKGGKKGLSDSNNECHNEYLCNSNNTKCTNDASCS